MGDPLGQNFGGLALINRAIRLPLPDPNSQQPHLPPNYERYQT